MYVLYFLIPNSLRLTTRPTEVFIRVMYDDFYDKHLEQILYFVTIFLFAPVDILNVFILGAKFWFFYFDSKLTEFITNSEWRVAIDPITESNNWFAQNVQKYGNSTYILSRLILFCLSCTVGMGLIDYSNPFGKGKITASLSFAGVILMSIAVQSYKMIQILIKNETPFDNLGIIRETIIQIAFASIACLVFTTAAIVFIIFYDDDKYLQIGEMYATEIYTIVFLYTTFPYAKSRYKKYEKQGTLQTVLMSDSESIEMKIKRTNYQRKNKTKKKMIKYSDYGKRKHKFTSSTNNLTHSLLSPERSPRDTENDKDDDDHRDSQYSNYSNSFHSNQSGKFRLDYNLHTWRGVVCTYDGFVAFMNHLGKGK